jgi:hypothetical protein
MSFNLVAAKRAANKLRGLKAKMQVVVQQAQFRRARIYDEGSRAWTAFSWAGSDNAFPASSVSQDDQPDK